LPALTAAADGQPAPTRASRDHLHPSPQPKLASAVLPGLPACAVLSPAGPERASAVPAGPAGGRLRSLPPEPDPARPPAQARRPARRQRPAPGQAGRGFSSAPFRRPRPFRHLPVRGPGRAAARARRRRGHAPRHPDTGRGDGRPRTVAPREVPSGNDEAGRSVLGEQSPDQDLGYVRSAACAYEFCAVRSCLPGEGPREGSLVKSRSPRSAANGVHAQRRVAAQIKRPATSG